MNLLQGATPAPHIAEMEVDVRASKIFEEIREGLTKIKEHLQQSHAILTDITVSLEDFHADLNDQDKEIATVKRMLKKRSPSRSAKLRKFTYGLILLATVLVAAAILYPHRENFTIKN